MFQIYLFYNSNPFLYMRLIKSLILLVNSMERILERYERYSYSERQLIANDLEQNVCSLSLDKILHTIFLFSSIAYFEIEMPSTWH